MLALSRPQSLRQGEAEKLTAYFERMSPQCQLSTSPVPDTMDGVYVVNLSTNEPPIYVSMSDLPDSQDIRAFDLSRIVRDLRDTMQQGDFNPTSSIINKSELGFDLMRRLLGSWGGSPKRRFSRAQKDNEITLALGLSNIYQAICDDIDSAKGIVQTPPKPEPTLNELTLQTIRDDERADRDDWHTSTNAWELVARGNVLSDAYLHSQTEDGSISDAPTPASWESWKITNASAGGYGLCWEGDQPSRAQVGELVGLRDQEGNDFQWRIGVVRWMQFEEGRGLEIGVQLLAPRTLLANVEHIHNRALAEALPIKAFILPGIKTIQLPASIVVPANLFRTGDQLSITVFGRQLALTLAKQGEHTSAFSQFRYQASKPKPKEPTPHKQNNFDSLWGNL